MTPDLVRDMGLFSYSAQQQGKPKPATDNTEIVITSREVDAVVEALLAPRVNYGVPRIVVRDVVNGQLYLEHLDRDTTFLDRAFTAKTLEYIKELWKNTVSLLTNDENGNNVTLQPRLS